MPHRFHFVRSLLPALLLAFAGTVGAAVELPGIVTILEGEATVLQGNSRVAAAEGLRLGAGAMVETDARTGVLRIEVGRAAIDLGPATRVMLLPDAFAARAQRPPALYLLQGWVKLSIPPGAGLSGIVSRAFDLPQQNGMVVAFVGPQEFAVFVETGEAQLVERLSAHAVPPIALRMGEWYVQSGAERGRLATHPTPTLVDRLPRAYRDTLPLRAAAFEGRASESKALAAPSYAELQPWLAAEPALRRSLVRRFAVRVREAEFRRALIANLPLHPEWRPLLFPPDPPKPIQSASATGR